MTAAELVSDGGMTVPQDPPELTIVPHHTDLPEGYEETNGARGQTDSYSHEGFPRSQSYLVSPISHPAARYSSVIALHEVLPDVPSAAASPVGSVLVAIISRLTRILLRHGWRLVHR